MPLRSQRLTTTLPRYIPIPQVNLISPLLVGLRVTVTFLPTGRSFRIFKSGKTTVLPQFFWSVRLKTSRSSRPAVALTEAGEKPVLSTLILTVRPRVSSVVEAAARTPTKALQNRMITAKYLIFIILFIDNLPFQFSHVRCFDHFFCPNFNRRAGHG
jgi:hypothetical protein